MMWLKYGILSVHKTVTCSYYRQQAVSIHKLQQIHPSSVIHDLHTLVTYPWFSKGAAPLHYDQTGGSAYNHFVWESSLENWNNVIIGYKKY